MSGPFASLNGERLQSAHVTIPYYGAWVADVVLATPDVIPTQSTLTIADLILTGTVYRMASFAGARSARIVGGFGGWRKTVPAQNYQANSGIRLSLVLKDAAAIVGEQVNVANDQTLGTSFTRESAPAERLLRQLAGPEWFVDTKGITQVGPRAGGAVSTPFTVVSWSGARGQFEIATENLSDWLPAKTFTANTVTTTQTVATTTIDMDNDGKLRLHILNAGFGSE